MVRILTAAYGPQLYMCENDASVTQKIDERFGILVSLVGEAALARAPHPYGSPPGLVFQERLLPDDDPTWVQKVRRASDYELDDEAVSLHYHDHVGHSTDPKSQELDLGVEGGPLVNCRTSNAVCLFAAAFATLACLAAVVAGSGDARRSEPRRFIFTTKPAAIAGCTMVCPAHEHGTPAEARTKLIRVLTKWPQEEPSSLYVCRVEQLRTVEMFAPLVDRLFVNPLVHRSNVPPSEDSLIWPNLDHPVINQLRQLYKNAGSTPLIACIDMDGDKALYPTRAPSFEEIEWMSLGIIGSGFKGIAWKGRGEAKPWAGRLRRLTSRLKAHASDLGASVPVNWVSSEKGRAYSAMASKDALIVVVLDPRYLRPSGRMEGVAFPVDDQPVSGTLVLCPPEAVTIEAGTKLDGSPVAMRIEDGLFRVDYKFHGAGDILILPLKKQNVATNDSCRNAPDAVSRRATASRRSE